MHKATYIQIIIRVVLLVVNGILIYIAYRSSYTINILGFLLILIFQFFLLIDYLKKIFQDVEKSIDCLLYDDYTISIAKEKQENSLYKKTALLIDKHKNQMLQQSSEQLIFTNIIESLATGILILKKDTSNTITVNQLNTAFVNFIDIPKFYNWNLLQHKIAPILEVLDMENWQRVKHEISITINQKEESFFLTTAITNTHNYQYLVISLETIQQLIAKKEKESWYKLMNVMSHEIINTITPISSLADNLGTLLVEDVDEETLNELSQGLDIIKKRSQHLTSFVNTYRKLAELPLPKKEQTDINLLISNTLNLFDQQFEKHKIKTNFDNSVPHFIAIDKSQIEQLIINLITNAIFALKEIDNPQINILISNNSKNLTLTFIDNGIGISKKIKANIFVPYFTTRKKGSGIGLTLVKSIVESHGGRIYFTSEKGETHFVMNFPNS